MARKAYFIWTSKDNRAIFKLWANGTSVPADIISDAYINLVFWE